MTAFGADLPTKPDPGRETGGRGGAVTLPDFGRSRQDEARTRLDPGRTDTQPGWARTLPARLAERFEIIGDLTGSGQQADVYLVRVREGGGQRVLKVHRPDSHLDEAVAEYLLNRRGGHVVEVEEIDEEDARQYEVMEYVAGGTLLAWRDRHPSGMDESTLVEIVRQLFDGIGELHEAKVLHRDIKPANVLIRSLDPLDLVITDLGISRHLPLGEAFTQHRDTGSPPFTPPEFVSGGRMEPAFDWWSVGVTVVELATGAPLFPGIDDPLVLQSYVGSAPLSVAGVSSDRVRMLCGGLLTRDPELRWGAGEVEAWLRGESPSVATEIAPPDGAGAVADEPYLYLGGSYSTRSMLATAMYNSWETARAVLFGADPEPLARLRSWLTQFPDVRPPVKVRRRASPDVRLLHELRALHPPHPPIYRQRTITTDQLPGLADQAVDGVEGARDIVADLWQEKLLPALATGRGGDGVAEVAARWEPCVDLHDQLAEAVREPEPRAELRRTLRHDRPYAWSLALLATTAPTESEGRVRAMLADLAHTLNVPWFSALVADSAHLWIAYTLRDFANREAMRRDREERARREGEERLRRTHWHREWSRRQNRPQALGYAVTGVAAVAVLLFALVGLSDIVDFSSESQIVDAWLAVSVALTATTFAESLLAWTAGGSFHPRYSFLSTGAVVLGQAARNLIALRIAVPVAAVFLAVLVVLTLYRPVVTPFVLTVLVLVWTVVRFRRWRTDVRRDQEILAQHEGPSVR